MLDRLGVLKAVDAAGAAPLARHAHHRARRHRPRRTLSRRRRLAALPRSTRWAWRARRSTARWSSACARCRWTCASTPAWSTCCVEAGVVAGVRVERPRRAQSSTCARALVVGADGRASVVAQRLGLPAAAPAAPHGPGHLRERARDCQRPRRDLRGPARLRDPQPGRARPREPGAGGAARPRARRGATGSTISWPRACASCRTWPAAWPAPRAWRPSARSARSRTASSRRARAACCWSATPAGFYDPFTGEGVFTALRSAELAADDDRQRAAGAATCRRERSPATSGPGARPSAARSG